MSRGRLVGVMLVLTLVLGRRLALKHEWLTVDIGGHQCRCGCWLTKRREGRAVYCGHRRRSCQMAGSSAVHVLADFIMGFLVGCGGCIMLRGAIRKIEAPKWRKTKVTVRHMRLRVGI